MSGSSVGGSGNPANERADMSDPDPDPDPDPARDALQDPDMLAAYTPV